MSIASLAVGLEKLLETLSQQCRREELGGFLGGADLSAWCLMSADGEERGSESVRPCDEPVVPLERAALAGAV